MTEQTNGKHKITMEHRVTTLEVQMQRIESDISTIKSQMWWGITVAGGVLVTLIANLAQDLL
jgi:hypothetical protein